MTAPSSTTLDAALKYARRGWPVLPLHGVTDRGHCTCSNGDCKKVGKHPRTEHGLKDATCDEEIIRRWFARWPDANVGMRTDCCVVLDVDPRHGGDKSLAALEQKYGALPVTLDSRTGGGGRHVLFALPNGQNIRNSAGKLGPGLDVRAEGEYVVLPPSLHSSGNHYKWTNDCNPVTLPEWLAARMVAPDQLLQVTVGSTRKIGEGERNKAAAPEAIEVALLEQNRLQCNPPLDEREVKRIAASVARYQPGSAAPQQDWRDPLPIGEELPPVPSFDPELLPSSLRPVVEDVSERMQTPLDYAAAVAVISLAGCVNRRAIIQPKVFDTSWTVVPNLWGMIVGPPGVLKSAIQQAVTRPLAVIESQWQAEYQKELREFEKQQRRGNGDDDEDDKPIQRRLVLMDATFEKLHEILRDNPCGVIIVRDELFGWMAQLERRGREGERQFFLMSWDGHAGFTIDRIERGSIYVPHVCVSMLGGIQPARLRSYLSEVLSGGPADDGLMQRFQVAVWPDAPTDWKRVDRLPNYAALDCAGRVYSRLVMLSPDHPVKLRFATDAQELFFDWWEELEIRIRGNSGLTPVMVSHLAKYRSLMPSLAGLFELADRAAVDENFGDDLAIDLGHAQQAAAWAEYLELHAQRLYSCVVSPERQAATALAGHIRRGALNCEFTTRDVYLKGWSGLDQPEKVQGALQFLEDANWVRHKNRPVSESGGRPSELWAINPKVKRHAK